MLATILSLLPTILFPILDFFWKKWANTEERKKEYIAFLEIMARKGSQSASNRLAAQEQIKAVNDLWKQEAEKEK